MLWNKFNLFTFNIICNIILSITKKTARTWKFGIVDDGSSSANCQFVLVLLINDMQDNIQSLQLFCCFTTAHLKLKTGPDSIPILQGIAQE